MDLAQRALEAAPRHGRRPVRLVAAHLDQLEAESPAGARWSLHPLDPQARGRTAAGIGPASPTARPAAARRARGMPALRLVLAGQGDGEERAAQVLLAREHRGDELAPRPHPETAEPQGGQRAGDRALREEQPVRDLVVRQPEHDEPHDLALTRRERQAHLALARGRRERDVPGPRAADDHAERDIEVGVGDHPVRGRVDRPARPARARARRQREHDLRTRQPPADRRDRRRRGVIGRHRQHDHIRRAGARVGVGDRPPHVRGDPLARERGADPRDEHVVAADHRDRETSAASFASRGTVGMPPPARLAATCETPICYPLRRHPRRPRPIADLLTRHGDGSAVHCRAGAVHAVDAGVTSR